jgi:hypothetical protein
MITAEPERNLKEIQGPFQSGFRFGRYDDAVKRRREHDGITKHFSKNGEKIPPESGTAPGIGGDLKGAYGTG